MADLYSYKGAFPYPLPQDMSHYDINDFYLAPPAPSLSPGYVLGWDATQWTVRPPNDAELEIQWAAVRIQRYGLLSESDVYVVRAYENGEPVPQDTVDYRQALRDVTNQPDPFAIQWPVPPPNPF
jgi:hypothetical protein